ncbi:MAG: hypothetical protein PWQ10_120 [Patescibacteria group bacterium]|nr:hypothetical protein [Patescibacteria group bacterium]
MKRYRDRGDTLVEVLFAITVFSLVAVSSISIMNQGSATEQRALEITLVRQEIDAQAEALRFLNSSYISAYRLGTSNDAGTYNENTPSGQWFKLKDYVKSPDAISPVNNDSASCSNKKGSFPQKSFILNAKKAVIVSNAFDRAQTYAQVRYNNGDVYSSEGIWIEAISPNVTSSSNNTYIDFYIRACWDSPGQSVPVRLGTIVRLYEPRG